MTKDKKELRVQYLGIRGKLTQDKVDSLSKQIFQKVLSIEEIWSKKKFGVYLPTKNEADTKLLVNKLQAEEREVFLPRFFENQKAYFFVKFSSWMELEAGYYGILQPINATKIITSELEAIFIPGVAFDKTGVRLGWGTGAYDKLLGGSKALKIGLAYGFQIASALPREEHDLRVDMVVSEKRILRTAST